MKEARRLISSSDGSVSRAASEGIGTAAKAGASSGVCGVESGAECWSSAGAGVALASAALFAAHLAFIVAASCAPRSGERLRFFFAFLLALGFFDSVICVGDFFSMGVEGLGAGRAA